MTVRRRFLTTGIAGVVIASLSLTACGTRAGSATADPGAKKIVTIGVIAPLSGNLSSMGTGIQNSVDLAVKQANASGALPGWTIRIDAQDDQASPDVGKNAATKLAGEKDVVAVVGPLNSSVGQAIQPILDPATIALVSPANTNPTLTRGADASTAPKRTYASYFRTCTTDAVQGPFAAQYLLDAGIKEVATVHDKKAYGQGLVTEFTKAFTAGGGTIVAAETVNPDDKDFAAVIAKIKPTAPQALYYGGEHPVSSLLTKQMKDAGLTIPLMGGDGMYDPAYITNGGTATEGDLVTSVGAPAESLPSAKQFVSDYQAAGYSSGYSTYGLYAYDAANAIIEALKVSLPNASDATAARQPTVAALGKVDVEGASGKVSFDEFGDNKTRVLTVYKVKNGAWVADKTGEFK
ncbi:branched-chain amino acid ABC transporter substrate-binding protein [Raineyella sp. LH-20]|uniref:branched-chain amino acid ABC transporter substrate-binding protein n=1 Tax=Raineyella sp. LH-20 TaxID=3081204 RepID=UPI002952EFF2|nr:branched-chain amino acid ABC transporter substrate-binding protein [Raineyella sp. LH-20]WOP19104.1 branched-chain amino acid ABC transporter substrate-binding protein [Raineyella sp. LH-20]